VHHCYSFVSYLSLVNATVVEQIYEAQVLLSYIFAVRFQIAALA